MSIFSPEQDSAPPQDSEYQLLNPRQIKMIEEAIRSIGEYGEVRLVIEKGRLRFLITQKSIDTLKWQPGSIDQKI